MVPSIFFSSMPLKSSSGVSNMHWWTMGVGNTSFWQSFSWCMMLMPWNSTWLSWERLCNMSRLVHLYFNRDWNLPGLTHLKCSFILSDILFLQKFIVHSQVTQSSENITLICRMAFHTMPHTFLNLRPRLFNYPLTSTDIICTIGQEE